MPSEAPAPVPAEVLDRFVGQGPISYEALEAFARGRWGVKFPTVVAAWRRAWTHVIPFFASRPEVRRVIDATHALESVHAQLVGVFRMTTRRPR